MLTPREAILDAWVAEDPLSRDVLAGMRQAASTRTPLLLRGETGTGKHLAALVIHRLGPYAMDPLLNLDCVALPPFMLESELFGAEMDVGPGVFHVTRGVLEAARAGTLVLNEITALPFSLQQRLSRTLREGQFCRNGGRTRIPLNARVIALTSGNPNFATVSRDFEPLSIRIPPLRERPLDIRPLAQHMLRGLCQLHRRSLSGLKEEAVAALEAYPWPGNVRELRQLLERALLGGAGDPIGIGDLPNAIRVALAQADILPQCDLSLEEVERKHIARVLAFTRGRKSDAATALGISRKTLLEKRKRYGLG